MSGEVEGVEIIVKVNGYRRTLDQAVEAYRYLLESHAKQETQALLRAEEKGWPHVDRATGARLDVLVSAKRQDPITRLGNSARV